MARDPRFIPPELIAVSGPLGPLIEVTTRTLHGRFLLRPSEDLTRITIGILARASRRYEVAVVGFVFLSNHYHLLVRTADVVRLAGFMGYLNGNLAKEAGRLHGWREKFWSRTYRAIPVSHEPEAQQERLRYLFGQGCKEGLVSRPQDWPGASSITAQLEGGDLEGTWFDRSKEYESRRCGKRPAKFDFASRERLRLHPPPLWDGIGEGEMRSEVAEITKEIVSDTRATFRRTGRKPLGPRRVRRQHPHAKPASSKRSPAPRFHAASWVVRRALEYSRWLFVILYRQAAEELKRGNLAAVFPQNCFRPRLPLPRGPTEAVPA